MRGCIPSEDDQEVTAGPTPGGPRAANRSAAGRRHSASSHHHSFGSDPPEAPPGGIEATIPVPADRVRNRLGPDRAGLRQPRHRPRDGLIPHSSSPDHPLHMDRPHRRTPPHQGHVEMPGGRLPARRARSAPSLTVVVGHGVGTGHRSALAGVPPQIRPGATVPDNQADAGLDPPEAPHSRGDGPVDLAGQRHRGSRPTAPRPAAGRGPSPPLGEAGRAWPTHSRPGPPGVQEPPPRLALSGPCTETQPARPRPTTQLEEPPPRHPQGVAAGDS
ncbi:hypothetical protein Save01_04016 [Streptomyces avermitilis]